MDVMDWVGVFVAGFGVGMILRPVVEGIGKVWSFWWDAVRSI